MKTRKIASVMKFERKIPIPRENYPLLMSQDRFCELFSITRETAAGWRKIYQIPYVNLPNRILYRVEDVQDFIEEKVVTTINNEQ